MLAKVEFAVGDNGVSPGLGFLVGGHKGAFEFVGGGGGFDAIVANGPVPFGLLQGAFNKVSG